MLSKSNFLLGNTAEMFQYGIQYWLAWVGSSLAFLFSAVVFVPFFHKLHLTSSFVVRNTMSAAYRKNVIYLDQPFLNNYSFLVTSLWKTRSSRGQGL